VAEQQVSLELTGAVFEAEGLPLADVVCTQEGQFGPGLLERMPEAGCAIAVIPHSLAGYT
jgi:hypothetical protein